MSSFIIQSSLVAPHLSVNCEVRWRYEGELVKRENFLVTINRPSQRLELGGFELTSLSGNDRRRSSQLCLEVFIDNRFRRSYRIAIHPGTWLTNCEGQLKTDVSELTFDEREADQILRKLGAAGTGPLGVRIQQATKKGGRFTPPPFDLW